MTVCITSRGDKNACGWNGKGNVLFPLYIPPSQTQNYYSTFRCDIWYIQPR